MDEGRLEYIIDGNENAGWYMSLGGQGGTSEATCADCATPMKIEAIRVRRGYSAKWVKYAICNVCAKTQIPVGAILYKTMYVNDDEAMAVRAEVMAYHKNPTATNGSSEEKEIDIKTVIR